MRRPRLSAIGLLAALAAALLALPVAAAQLGAPSGRPTATPIGSVPTAQSAPDNCAPLTLVQIDTAAGTTPYQVPSDGVITRWSHRAQDEFGVPGHVDLRMMLFTRDEIGEVTVKSRSSAERLVAGQLNSFPTRVEATAGDLLGLSFTGAATECDFDAGHRDDAFLFAFNFSSEPEAGDYFSGDIIPGRRGNISVVVEPDADDDGFGDVSQDRCPSQPTAGRACDRTAPSTTITTRPPAQTRSHHARFRLVGSEVQVTFRCSLDGALFRTCRTPATRRVGPGRHVFRVVGVDRWGNRDKSPAVARWRVTA